MTDPKLRISLQGAAIRQVKEAKLLGVTQAGTLSCSTPINNMVAKMSGGISIIRRCAYYVAEKTSNTVACFITPQLLSSNLV